MLEYQDNDYVALDHNIISYGMLMDNSYNIMYPNHPLKIVYHPYQH